MAEKDMSDAEIDKMIDESIKQEKEKPKAAPKKETAKEAEPKPQEKKEAAKKTQEKTGKTQEKAAEKEAGYNPWNVLKYPSLTEKSINMVELQNKLVFIVKRNSTKARIKEAVEKGFNVKVLAVKTEITMTGEKKAYVKLQPDYMAADIATRLGMI
jgi:large subunit ribosomal protein L23